MMWRTQREQQGRAALLCPIYFLFLNMYYVSRNIPEEEFLLGCNKFIYYNFSYVTSPQKGNRSFTPDFPRFEVRSKVYENISIYVIIALLVTHARDP